jgi:hypothetical protein
MRRRFVALLGLVTVVAGCSAAGATPVPLPTLRTFIAPPTLGPGPSSAPPSAGPSASASPPPSATTAPTPTPSPPPPTATPTPPPTAPPTAPPPTASPTGSADGETDPTSEAALRNTLLELDDVPATLTDVSDTIVDTTSDVTGFKANKGLRVMGREIDGTGTIARIIDERWQFPTKAAAHRFLGTAEKVLGGASQGLGKRTDVAGLGDESAQYQGSDIAGVGDQVFVQLVRMKNVVARVQVIGSPDLAAEDADKVGSAAAARLDAAILGTFPTADEAAVLAHVPADIAESCARIYEIYWAETESVRCRPAGAPLLDYTTFPTVAAMDADFDDDLDSAGKPTTEGTCATGKYQNTYNIDGVHAGRLMCVKRGTARVIEWTSEPLRIITSASSTTLSFDKLHDYWADEAGPYEQP